MPKFGPWGLIFRLRRTAQNSENMSFFKVLFRPKLSSRSIKARQVLRCLSSMSSPTSDAAGTFDSSTVPSGDEARVMNKKLRIDLAAAYREFDRLDLNEGIDNHLSVMAPAADGSGNAVMLIHPFGLHWSEITASSLVALDENGDVVEGDGEPCYSTGPIHFTIHKMAPKARCLMHLHPTHFTALACLKDPSIKLLHANSAFIYDAITYDNNYAGFAVCKEEGERLAQFFGPKIRILLMGNHGALVSGVDVASAFFDLYFLERSCQFQLLAMSTGQPLNELQRSDYDGGTGDLVEQYRTPYVINKFFDSVKRRLIRDCPDFMD